MNPFQSIHFTDKERDIISNRLSDVFNLKDNVRLTNKRATDQHRIVFVDRKILMMNNNVVVDIEFLSEVKNRIDVDLAFQLNLSQSLENLSNLTEDWRKSLYSEKIDLCQSYEKGALAIRLRNELRTKNTTKLLKI
ncbi:hypothetical protein [Burkholderia gladioli]|uniref:hypothetical protein n=1 Tax=Burkholderia gladioli TaxID=28095 RepID=UPI00164023B4|nr:hypothetical protein [Burkholderia gladioli]